LIEVLLGNFVVVCLYLRIFLPLRGVTIVRLDRVDLSWCCLFNEISLLRTMWWFESVCFTDVLSVGWCLGADDNWGPDFCGKHFARKDILMWPFHPSRALKQLNTLCKNLNMCKGDKKNEIEIFHNTAKEINGWDHNTFYELIDICSQDQTQ
jgi:hypothetical protein